jgi:hypothetical protein
MKAPLLFLVILLSALAVPRLALAQAKPAPQWDDAQVEKSIAKAKEFLWSKWSQGHWPEPGRPGNRDGQGHSVNYGGVTALCTYALLAAGETTKEDRLKQTLEWLAAANVTGVYARAMRANVWAAMGRSGNYGKILQADVDALVAAADEDGTYDYVPPDPPPTTPWSVKHSRYDNSNSQLAVLGVWGGVVGGVPVKPAYWKLIEKHWIDDQAPSGGWAYMKASDANAYGSMTVAGLATMFICYDNLYSDKQVESNADFDYPPITAGLAWVDKNFLPDANPGKGRTQYYYYLYGVERVGLASGYKYFGQKDWYKLGTANLLRLQAADGRWGEGNMLEDTAFALIFLARGRQAVLFNKLKYDGNWNPRPRDLASLTRWLSITAEHQVNWQIIPLGVPVTEWHDAPILYISGTAAPNFSDKDLDQLRDFTRQGGMLLSEAAGSRAEFTLAMRKVYARIFPDYQLKELPADHPVYNINFKVTQYRGLLGVSNGARLLAIHAPSQLSLAWQTGDTKQHEELFNLAANIYLHTTDKGILPPRGVSHWPVAQATKPVATVAVAPLKYRGNWQAEPLALKRLAILLGNRNAIEVAVGEPVEIAKLDPAKYPFVMMSGTEDFTFTAEETAALAKYLNAGGTILAESTGGGKAFAAASLKQFQAVLPDAAYRVLPADHALYTQAAFAIESVNYRRVTRTEGTKSPRLTALLLDGRPAVILTPDDLTEGFMGCTASDIAGYDADSAVALMRNILLYANGKKIK